MSRFFAGDRLLYSPDDLDQDLHRKPRDATGSIIVARELALLVSGASGSVLARQFAVAALASGHIDALHLVLTGAATKVMAHELGPDWASARRFRDNLPLDEELRGRVHPHTDTDIAAQVASGSHRLIGVVVLPCSAGMAGSLANGISRGLAQRVADVALKQRWPLLIGIRETPMSEILLANLLTLARAGAHIVPPVPAFYLRPDEVTAQRVFVDHYCLRLLDLLSIPTPDTGLRWPG
jgi:4-hydroxy-3-polyprenylbenzoate decarboxylase